MRLSIVIPCYNEAANIPLLLERCRELDKQPGIEVVLVDNGSTDTTQILLAAILSKYPACRSVRVEKNQGYGFGILSGLKAATGDILGWTHADMQTDPQDALLGLQLFEQNGPEIFVKGKRYGRPVADVAFTVGMSAFETIMMGKPMWDINAQPTMFSRQFFESWGNPPYDFSLDLYAYYHAKAQRKPVFRFPVRFCNRAHGVSHWNVSWSAKQKFINQTLSYSIEMRSKYKKNENKR